MLLRRLISRSLDAAVFVPLGLLLEGRTVVPHLAEVGRRHAGEQVGAVLGLLGRRSPAPPPVDTPAPPRLRVVAPAAPVDVEIQIPVDVVPSADTLPLPGYDALAASQIVARLADLDADALAAVAAYEASHRNRRTVLARVAQLRGG